MSRPEVSFYTTWITSFSLTKPLFIPMHTSLRFVTLASANGIHRKQKGRILRKKEVISPSICVEENWFNQVIIISLETFNIFSSSFLMWTKIPQMCFRIHFREGRTAKLHSWKKFQRSQLPSFSVSFPPSIQSCYIHPRILASFSSLFMIHPEFWEQGGFRTTIPSFQIFAFDYFLSIFALPYSPLLSECQKSSPTLYFSTPNPRLLHCNTSDFCALKNTLYVPKVSF